MEAEKAKLLVAEDEEEVRRGIVGYVRRHSQRIGTLYEAEDGQAALDCIIRHKPDLLLIDIQMPCKTGLEVLAEAREAGFCPKAVILSGYDEFSFAQRAIRAGVEDYLLKPCRPQELLEKLESLLDATEAADAKPETRMNRLVYVALQYLQEHYMQSPSLSEVAAHVGISAPYLSSLFGQELGCGFSDYLNRLRIERACAYLHDPSVKTYEVSERVGYQNEKYFTRQFKKQMGVSPSAYRRTASAAVEEQED